jgi:hypothetical protein
MRPAPDAPDCWLRETTIRIVLDRAVAIEFYDIATEPALIDDERRDVAAGSRGSAPIAQPGA